MMDHLRRLFAHLEWSDQRALDSLRSAPGVEPQVLALMAHIVGAEEVWLARIEQRPPAVAVWPELDLEACARLARENHARYRELLETLQPADLLRAVSYRNSAGVSFESQLGDILTHVALHGAYHRGQVAAGVRRAGVAPLFTDYIAFVRGGAPATRSDADRTGTVDRAGG